MTREEFQSRLMDVRGPDSAAYDRVFDAVRERLRGLNDAQKFAILFPVAVKSQTDAPSWPAAQLLREFSPECPLKCEDALRALLPDWDVSIEEVPFYLAARFGSDRVRQAIVQAELAITSNTDKQRLKTVAYWLDRYDGAYAKNNS